MRSSDAAAIRAGADRLGATRAFQHLDRRVALPPVLCAAFKVAPATWRMRGEDQTRAHRPALDAVPADQFEHQIGTGGDRIDDALAALGAVVTQDRLVSRLQIRHHLAECASRCAPADLLRLQHRDVDAGLGQMQRGRKPGEARADDGDRNMTSCPPAPVWAVAAVRRGHRRRAGPPGRTMARACIERCGRLPRCATGG